MPNNTDNGLFRYPDKPALSLRYGQKIPAGYYICQYKPDGERCLITYKKGEPLQIVSRHNRPLKDQTLALELAEPLGQKLAYGHCTTAVFDAELTTPRRGAKRANKSTEKPRLWLLDFLRFSDRLAPESCVWFNESAADRWHWLSGFLFDWNGHNTELEDLSRLAVPCEFAGTDSEISAFIESAREQAPASVEGVVLKQVDSPFIGSVAGSALNPGWLKVKW